MLVLQDAFGIPVVESALPSLTGAFYGYTEGVCAEGKDFVCNVKDGLWTCRPCDFAQLSQFKQLQHMANRLATGFGISRDKLAETDARIGRITATLVGLVSRKLSGMLAPPSGAMAAVAAAQEAPTDHETFRAIAKAVPELVSWFDAGIALTGAPSSYPTPPPQPRAEPSGDSPITIPEPGRDGLPPLATRSRRMKMAGAAVGILGVVTAVGLVAAAHYSKKGRRLR
jgi:hypothetical protein